jgi:hypothetical protein
VNGHLIAVEVSIERCANQRMQLDRLAFDQGWLERLDAETMQCRCPVEHDGVLANDLVEDVPNLALLLLHQLLGLLHRRRLAESLEAGIDEGLEEFERHLFRQAALVQLELGAHHDHRPARIVDALTQ